MAVVRGHLQRVSWLAILSINGGAQVAVLYRAAVLPYHKRLRRSYCLLGERGGFLRRFDKGMELIKPNLDGVQAAYISELVN